MWCGNRLTKNRTRSPMVFTVVWCSPVVELLAIYICLYVCTYIWVRCWTIGSGIWLDYVYSGMHVGTRPLRFTLQNVWGLVAFLFISSVYACTWLLVMSMWLVLSHLSRFLQEVMSLSSGFIEEMEKWALLCHNHSAISAKNVLKRVEGWNGINSIF